MKIQLKAPLIVVSITLMTAGLSAYSSYSANVRMIEAAKQRELRTTATVIQTSIAEQTSKASARAALVTALPSIKDAFRHQDRAELARRLVPAFLEQREKFGVREGHFHLAPAISFLRLFDLEAGHGEDLSGFREMVLATNRHQEPQKGVEIGRRGLSIRGVYPVEDAAGPMGSFEVGMSFSTVLEDTKRTTGFDAGVFVDDSIMERVATSMPRPAADHVIGGFQAVESTDWAVLKTMATPDLLTKVNDVTTRLPTVGGVEYGMVLVPVLDFKGSGIGSVVATKSFAGFQSQARQALVTAIGFAFLQAALLAGALILVLNGMLIRPLALINTKISKLTKGEKGQSLASISAAQDEIGQMARHLDALEGSMSGQDGRRETGANV